MRKSSSAHFKAQTRLELFARQHRSALTASEARLWAAINARQLGVSFRRQVPLAGFIADFFAPSIALIIEVDGAIHAPSAALTRAASASCVAPAFASCASAQSWCSVIYARQSRSSAPRCSADHGRTLPRQSANRHTTHNDYLPQPRAAKRARLRGRSAARSGRRPRAPTGAIASLRRTARGQERRGRDALRCSPAAPAALLETSDSRAARPSSARLRAFESRHGSVRTLRDAGSRGAELIQSVPEVRIPPAVLGFGLSSAAGAILLRRGRDSNPR